jgi:uncharacterized protein (DUF305 family)
MIEHHQGGVMMAEAAIDLVDEEVLHNLASTIVTTQTAEITNMQALIAELEAA